MDYKNLHWESIAFLQEHLYQRLTDPLNKAIGFLEMAKGVEFNLNTPKLIGDAGHNLEILMMLVRSWSLLTEWKFRGSIAETEFQPLSQEKIPQWLLDEIGEHAIVRLEHTRTLKVQHETFFEGLILLTNIAKIVGEISHIMSNDAEEPHTGVWMRVVFKPPKTEGYQSRAAVLDYLNSKDSPVQDGVVQYAVADDLFTMNNARFSLQKNTRTGHQAFAMLLPVMGRAASTPPKLADMVTPSLTLPQTGTLVIPPPIEEKPTPVEPIAEVVETPAIPSTPKMVSPIVPELLFEQESLPPVVSEPLATITLEPPAVLIPTPPEEMAAPASTKRLTLLEIVKRTETSDGMEGDKSETLIINPFKTSGINMTPPEPLTLPPQGNIPEGSIPLNLPNSTGMGALSKALLQMHAEANLSPNEQPELPYESRNDAANESLAGGEQPNDTNSGSSASA